MKLTRAIGPEGPIILLFLGCSAALGLLWWPAHVKSRNQTNELAARDVLGRLARAQFAWRASDCDRNGKADFWTLDVYGLCHLKDKTGKRVGAITDDIARADRFPAAGDAQYDERPPAQPTPYMGYYFEAMALDHEGKPYTGESQRRFAFRAVPAVYGQTGVRTLQVNEGGIIYGRDLGYGAEANPPRANWEGHEYDLIPFGWHAC